MKDILKSIAQGAWDAISPLGTIFIGVTTTLLALRMAGCGQPGPNAVMRHHDEMLGPAAPIRGAEIQNGSQVLYDMHR